MSALWSFIKPFLRDEMIAKFLWAVSAQIDTSSSHISYHILTYWEKMTLTCALKFSQRSLWETSHMCEWNWSFDLPHVLSPGIVLEWMAVYISPSLTQDIIVKTFSVSSSLYERRAMKTIHSLFVLETITETVGFRWIHRGFNEGSNGIPV